MDITWGTRLNENSAIQPQTDQQLSLRDKVYSANTQNCLVAIVVNHLVSVTTNPRTPLQSYVSGQQGAGMTITEKSSSAKKMAAET